MTFNFVVRNLGVLSWQLFVLYVLLQGNACDELICSPGRILHYGENREYDPRKLSNLRVKNNLKITMNVFLLIIVISNNSKFLEFTIQVHLDMEFNIDNIRKKH